jgi:hypothetical protein
MAEQTAEGPHIEFRVGINIGDITTLVLSSCQGERMSRSTAAFFVAP